MNPKPQPTGGDWLTEEVFNRNLHQELERSPFKNQSFERLIRGFPEQELVHHLFGLAAAYRTFPRTTRAGLLKPYEMNLKSFKTMLRQVERFAEFIERVNQKCANEDAAWRGFHWAAENIRNAVGRAKRWVRNPSQTVPKDMLCALVYRVKERTGKPRYRHVENLLEAAFAAAEVKNPPFLSAEDIRKLCKQKRTPEPRGGGLDCARK
jgi:hypothetical protein